MIYYIHSTESNAAVTEHIQTPGITVKHIRVAFQGRIAADKFDGCDAVTLTVGNSRNYITLPSDKRNYLKIDLTN